MRKSKPITTEEWLAELDRIEQGASKKPEGFTRMDVQQKHNKSSSWATEHLLKMINAGKVKYVGKRPVENCVGSIGYIPVYQIVRKGKK